MLGWTRLLGAGEDWASRHPGYSQGYLAENGPFANRDFEHLGGVGVFTVDLPSGGMRYRFELFENPFALPTVTIPKTVLAQYARHIGAG